MERKNNLLSIGEVSKLTDVGIKSLRYYEKINILKPAYVSPESGYRYYALEQLHLIEMIRFCIELDIPLSEMSKFIEPDGTMDLRGFFKEGRAFAEKKLSSLNKGLNLINSIEHKMNLAKGQGIGKIYSRKIPTKYFFIKPWHNSMEDADQIEILKSFWNTIPYDEDDNELYEYGFMCIKTSEKIEYFLFAETPKNLQLDNLIEIPAGNYSCILSQSPQIENTSEIFKNKIGDSFISIETSIITERYNITKPIHELRIK
ncbi:MAG: MerR family DNA-binding transcriptional regulator [Defluviitaleaceae bacterium]|nr:MerR family DNA-binding transcriptional regulator [Defluviitaleaceae bacterium]